MKPKTTARRARSLSSSSSSSRGIGQIAREQPKIDRVSPRKVAEAKRLDSDETGHVIASRYVTSKSRGVTLDPLNVVHSEDEE